jgi:uncharacterized protein YdaT
VTQKRAEAIKKMLVALDIIRSVVKDQYKEKFTVRKAPRVVSNIGEADVDELIEKHDNAERSDEETKEEVDEHENSDDAPEDDDEIIVTDSD